MADPVVGFDGLWDELRDGYANEIRDLFLDSNGFVEGRGVRRFLAARGDRLDGPFVDIINEFLADGWLELHGDNYIQPTQFQMACRDTVEKLTDLVNGSSDPTPPSHSEVCR